MTEILKNTEEDRVAVYCKICNKVIHLGKEEPIPICCGQKMILVD